MSVMGSLPTPPTYAPTRIPPTKPVSEPPDLVNHPPHYTSGPFRCSSCGHPIECIDITRHFPFALGNVIKYLWREGLKGTSIQDLEKSAWYLADEIAERKRMEGTA